ncbi:ATP-binding protein, partial [Streptomyces sp. NPDC059455]|uniref:ATP-binding protein n=1 Tax=Streptomyces sp. NPDC059455 TaxID=3346837 RepID=UPI0036CF5E2E
PRDSTRTAGTGYGQVAAATRVREQVPAPDGWTKTFTDPRLCAAIVDRLTFNGAIIQTGTESYRLAHTKSLAERTEAS